MQSQKRWALVAVGTLFAWASGSTKAHAYCQTTTSEQQVSSCSLTCVTDGYPLAWPSSKITYVFNERGFPGLSDDEMRGIFADAFGAWENVDCEGGRVGLEIEAAKQTTALTVGPLEQEPNASVIAHLPADEWLDLDLDPRAFALTAIWFDENSGRIFGSDMHFNGGMAPFGVCPDEGCGSNQRLTDLPNVATHEAGHFLGLAHSQDQDSTMWCDAQGNETNKRTLSEDDEKGICAAYPRGIAFTEDYFPTPDPRKRTSNDRGCSAMAGFETRGSWGFGLSGLVALSLVFRRRRN